MKDNQYWMIGGLTFIGTDTVTTKLALDTGKAFEANPLANFVIDTHGYIGIVLLKTSIFVLAYIAWYFNIGKDTERDEKMNWLLPRFITFVGAGVTLTNSIQLSIIYMM